MRGGSSLRNGSSGASSPSRSRRAPASAAELFVGGQRFYPPMLADIEAAASSVHINQFGFRPGDVGERFAAALVAKARSGVPVRIVVDEQGSKPYDASRELYERLAGSRGGGRGHARDEGAGSRRSVRWDRPAHALESSALGHIDHRKAVVVDGRIGWVGGAGIEDHFDDGRFHDLFVRLEGAVVGQLQLVFIASFRWLGGTIPGSRRRRVAPPGDQAAAGDALPSSSCTTLPAATAPSPMRSPS